MNPVTLNLIDEKVGNSLEAIDTGDYSLHGASIVQSLKLTINKWVIRKLKSTRQCTLSIGQNQKPRDWEKIITHPTVHRGPISRIYKHLRN